MGKQVRLHVVDGEALDYPSDSILQYNDTINKALLVFFPRCLLNFEELAEFAENELHLQLNWVPKMNRNGSCKLLYKSPAESSDILKKDQKRISSNQNLRRGYAFYNRAPKPGTANTGDRLLLRQGRRSEFSRGGTDILRQQTDHRN